MGKVFVLAPDSFKESMTAKEVCKAMEIGIKRAIPDAECIHVPMADGGEGTVQSLIDATGGTLVKKEVTGPLGTKVVAGYGILGDGKTAVIEMAAASGIHFVTKETKNPLITTTYGTGELIKDCIEQGITDIILGIGGSATNDGGTGMAAALGYKFLDEDGKELKLGGGFLDRLATIDTSNVIPGLRDVHILVASDVTNPLCGEHGASRVFGPQKGATPEMVEILDNNLRHYAQVVKDQLGIDVLNVPGAGAAGGLGAGLLAFTNATMKKGIEIVIEYTNLKEKLRHADYCFTGEGGIDFQTKFGKTPYGVAKVAKSVNPNMKVIALAGYIGKDVEVLYEEGFDAIFGVVPGAAELSTLLKQGSENVARTAESVARLLR
ncbi:glycerate kinase [Caldibacillus sp. 210928-DFI.2.22]|uniref:glycerate kinase family protein n=1 Tax=Caldibacillus TaxID=1276290 RepID=UPI000D556F88|nr:MULTISPECIES: glycerate kinase [Caldibacillus]AWI13713.1 glycerate 2-kinase [Caldibacillus thermoamylovorans]MCB7071580.1 glycerate kinase [Caldibacillus sp. 210928-DFI.2.22]MCB7075012.1 glycerate kinase [Caldibacillus sp. 210928-DFI.2.18]